MCIRDSYDHVHRDSLIVQKDSFHKVQPILSYVQQNFQNPITLDSIAQQFYMSKYYLCLLYTSTPRIIRSSHWSRIPEILCIRSYKVTGSRNRISSRCV